MPYVVRQKTGTAGTLKYTGTAVVFKKWSAKVMVNYADSTDSKNYDTVTKLTWRSQEPGDAGLEGTIEGYYDLNGKSAAFVEAMTVDPQPQEAEFGLDAATVFVTTKISITDFETSNEVDGANMIAFTCNWKSWGIPEFQTAVDLDTA